MTKIRFWGALGLSLAFASATVQAATATVAQVGDFHGKVLVNQGKGFFPVSGPLALKVGDKIMVGEQSFATVSYNECSVALSSPTVFSVGEKAPCAKGQNMAAVDGAFIAPTADIDPGCSGMACGTPALLPLLLVGGAAATVGVIVVASKKHHNSPAVSAP